jgi:hypothetical protein
MFHKSYIHTCIHTYIHTQIAHPRCVKSHNFVSHGLTDTANRLKNDPQKEAQAIGINVFVVQNLLSSAYVTYLFKRIVQMFNV